MIPKPPFARDLSPADEAAAFEQLKGRLAPLWAALFPKDNQGYDQPYTSVVVPSDGRPGDPATSSTHLEERLLFFLIRLRNAQARLVYVTSQPIHPIVVEYYLELLAGIPAVHARSRLTLLSAYDHSPRPLTQKILERPRLLERIRVAIPDKARAYLTVCDATPLERRLAVLLGIPMNALDPGLRSLATVEGSRAVFDEAGVPGDEPGAGAAERTPSVELRINPRGETILSSTHELLRSGAEPAGAACLFPAHDEYRDRLHQAGLRVGRVLAARRVTSRCSVQFAARRSSSGWDLRATAVRFGVVDVTHPMLALRLLTAGGLDAASGLFMSPRGQAKFYKASDAVRSDAYRGLLPEDLVEILTINRLSFDQRSETGVLFHMIGAVSQFGRLGMVAIGDTRAEAERLFDTALGTLDHETRYGR
jgi:hypothetical protein